MTGLPTNLDRLVVVGANHKSSTMMLRDRIFIEENRLGDVLNALADQGMAEVLALSTCDRVEVLADTDNAAAAEAAILTALASEGQMEAAELEGQTYTLTGADAARHMFRVTASLDSLMVGEPQVLGQVKAAHRLAEEAGTLGPKLDGVMQAAFAAAKKVRHETHIGEGPVSIAASALQVAREMFGDLSRCQVLLIGAGDMGEMIASDIGNAGVAGLTVTHPSVPRADALARELDAHAMAFEDLNDRLKDFDIVLTALGSRRFSLAKDPVKAAIKARRSRPQFIVDAGVPGDVDANVDELDDAFVYTLDDLEHVALRGRAGREQEVEDAERIIMQEVQAYLSTHAEREAVPALTRLRTQFERARLQALDDAGGDAEKATRLLAARLLHGPSEELRRMAASGTNLNEIEELLEKLFPATNGDET